ncbi:MAG: hypothetical protein KME26_04935 [Oscillatoria princeps RMCB-10]|jgi:hypothetical protein|nr:hypothetical protein [Oscillatoria princeps RMCB-10]
MGQLRRCSRRADINRGGLPVRCLRRERTHRHCMPLSRSASQEESLSFHFSVTFGSSVTPDSTVEMGAAETSMYRVCGLRYASILKSDGSWKLTIRFS